MKSLTCGSLWNPAKTVQVMRNALRAFSCPISQGPLGLLSSFCILPPSMSFPKKATPATGDTVAGVLLEVSRFSRRPVKPSNLAGRRGLQ